AALMCGFMRVGGIIVTWRGLQSGGGDCVDAAVGRGDSRGGARGRDPRRLARALGRGVGAEGWVVGVRGVRSLVGCAFFGGGSTASNTLSLSQVSWCDRKDISFRDESAPNADPLTNWADVKDQLGFTYYLPSSLPKGTCLMFVGGTIHDSVFN